jgi:hypothetical protein
MKMLTTRNVRDLLEAVVDDTFEEYGYYFTGVHFDGTSLVITYEADNEQD